MTDILQLALAEKNFTVSPPAKIVECCHFDLQSYISQAMRLLSLDQNLAHIHAKISPKMNEETFWEYYFARIYYLRCKSGILDSQTQDDAMVQIVASFAEEDVIYKAETAVGTSTASSSSAASKFNSMDTKKASPQNSQVLSSSKSSSPGVKEGKECGKKTGNATSWESSSGSGEDVVLSGSGSELSTSSYEVVGGVGSSSGKAAGGESGVGSEQPSRTAEEEEEALFEEQVGRGDSLIVCIGVCISVCYDEVFSQQPECSNVISAFL